jgi:hypothetical protein
VFCVKLAKAAADHELSRLGRERGFFGRVAIRQPAIYQKRWSHRIEARTDCSAYVPMQTLLYAKAEDT